MVSGARCPAAGGDRAAGPRPPRSRPRTHPAAGVPAAAGGRDGVRRRHDGLPRRRRRRRPTSRTRTPGPAPIRPGGARACSCPPELAGALVQAAVRETFEECGVLLAGPRELARAAPDPGLLARARADLVARRRTSGQLLAEAGLVLRADLLRAVGPLDHPGGPAAPLRHRVLRGAGAGRAAGRRAHHRGRRGHLVASRARPWSDAGTRRDPADGPDHPDAARDRRAPATAPPCWPPPRDRDVQPVTPRVVRRDGAASWWCCPATRLRRTDVEVTTGHLDAEGPT